MSISWTARTLPSAAAWEYVAYGAGTFVAITSGSSNTAATSTDNGATWTARTRAQSRTMNGLAYGSGVFLAIGQGSTNACETTPDGITWTTRPLPGIRTYKAVAFGAGTFATIANLTSVAAYSTDAGVTFTETALPASGDWYAVAWDGTVFCAVMRNSTNAATSPDGITWTARTLSASRDWRSIASDGAGTFVTLAYNTSVCAVSTDHGVTWTEYAMPTSNFWWGITWTGSTFVAVTYFDDEYAESADGTSWTGGTLPSSTGWHGIASDGAEHLVVVSNDTSTSALSGEGVLPVTINEPLALAQTLTPGVGLRLSTDMAVTTSTEVSEVNALREELELAGAPTAVALRLATLAETLGLTTQIRLVLSGDINDSLALADAAQTERWIYTTLVDGLRLTGAATTTLTAIAQVSETLALLAAARSVADGQINDTAALAETLNAQLLAMEELVAGAVFTDSAQGMATVVVQVDDTVALDETLTPTASLIAAINEGLRFAVGFVFNDTPMLGLSLNAATRGVSTYSNYSFNSLAAFGRSYYGAGDGGLYELSGDTDAGDAIVWRIRTGLTNLGTGRNKALDAAYLGFTASGRVALKCIVVDASTGEKIVHWYELSETAAVTPRGRRLLVGRGLRSVYWGFELTNVTAGDIALDVLELHPIVLEGRL